MSKLQECRQLHLSHLSFLSRCLSKPFLTMTQRRTRLSLVRRRGCLSERETFFKSWAKMMWHGGRQSMRAMPTPEQDWFPPSTSRNGEPLAQHGDLSSNDFPFAAEYHSSTVMMQWASDPACESIIPWVWIWSSSLSMTVPGPHGLLLWNRQTLAHCYLSVYYRASTVISGKGGNFKTWKVPDLVDLNR